MKITLLIILLFTALGFVAHLLDIQFPAVALWLLLGSAAALWGWAAWYEKLNADKQQ